MTLRALSFLAPGPPSLAVLIFYLPGSLLPARLLALAAPLFF